MKKGKVLLVVFAGILILLIIGISSVVGKMHQQLAKIDQTPVDLSLVADGTYEGESETELVKASVRVTVKEGAIKDIEILRHECGKGKPAEQMLLRMIEKNDVEVDAVSGATASSAVLKDAVRNALRKGLRP